MYAQSLLPKRDCGHSVCFGLRNTGSRDVCASFYSHATVISPCNALSISSYLPHNHREHLQRLKGSESWKILLTRKYYVALSVQGKLKFARSQGHENTRETTFQRERYEMIVLGNPKKSFSCTAGQVSVKVSLLEFK